MAAPMPEPAYVRAADLNLVSLFYVCSITMMKNVQMLIIIGSILVLP